VASGVAGVQAGADEWHVDAGDALEGNARLYLSIHVLAGLPVDSPLSRSAVDNHTAGFDDWWQLENGK